MSYSRQAGTQGLVGHGREHRTSRLVLRPSGPSNSISGCRLFIPMPTGLLLETRPNGVWSLVLGADHEETRSHPLARGYDVCQFDCCARAAARAAMPDWDCHAVPGERSKGNFVLSPSGNSLRK